MHINRPLKKSLQSFKLIGIKLYEELPEQGTHCLSSNTRVEKGEQTFTMKKPK